jgi:hypothetical protein
LYACCRDGFINLKPGLEALCLNPVRFRLHVRQAESRAHRLQFQRQGKLAQLRRQIQILREDEWGIRKAGPIDHYVNLALHDCNFSDKENSRN